MNRYVIVGNGVAGVKAAEVIRQRDPRGSITMISHEKYPFYFRPQLAGYAAGKVTDAQITARPEAFYKRNKIELIIGKSVAKVSPDERVVALADGTSFPYDALLLATGCSLETLDFPGAEKTDDIVKLMTLEDAKLLRRKMKPGKRASVVGDGFLTTALIDALLGGGMEVVYLISSDRFWPDVMDADASRIMEVRIQERGVEIVKNAQVKEVAVKSGAVAGLRLKDGSLVRCELAGLVGDMRPNVAFLDGSGIRVESGIVVDDRMRTSVKDVYAAGDVVQLKEMPAELPLINVRWLKAWRQGQVAGANMAGDKQTYQEYACFSSTQVAGVDLVAIGVSNPPDGGYKIMRGEYPHPDLDIYKKLVLKDDRVVGALLIGDVAEASEVHRAIRQGKKVDELDETLLRQMFDLSFPLTRYQGIVCPVCKLVMSISPDMKIGDTITCPSCGVEIKITRDLLTRK
jgi:NAD(P)H-nitrite reductase large subunit